MTLFFSKYRYLPGRNLRGASLTMFGIPTTTHDKELSDNADRASAKLTRANRDVLWWVLGAFVAGCGIMAGIYVFIG